MKLGEGEEGGLTSTPWIAMAEAPVIVVMFAVMYSARAAKGGPVKIPTLPIINYISQHSLLSPSSGLRGYSPLQKTTQTYVPPPPTTKLRAEKEE